MKELLENIDENKVSDPMKSASQSMRSQLPRRFYKAVSVEEGEDGFEIRLDGKPVRTPGRRLLAFPATAAAALAVREWESQDERIDPVSMPVTRLANTAIDGVAVDMQAVKEDIIRFAGSDLLCYRADGPDGLLDAQRKNWDPLIDWAHSVLNARFDLVEGVVHVTQPVETIAAFSAHVGMIDCPFTLTACHSMTSLTGSAITAMAVVKSEISLENAWAAAHVDEDWQISQWGEDAEAMVRREARRLEMRAAGELIEALGQ